MGKMKNVMIDVMNEELEEIKAERPVKESCRIHQRFKHYYDYFMGFFFVALVSTVVVMLMADVFPYCVTHVCCVSSGGWEGMIYSLSNLLNLVAILGTGYHGLLTGIYFISWKQECRKEESP